ncbi:spore coat protein [Bacillus safensis]|uniref:spore coat protein n=1 Tax=Bacillus safensis TaxID=561879 RepID=UPI000EF2B30A|nr:spore coat protein [Bacillus safensis]AYJ90085.1 spore coat protein [Bacillus safensis]
MNYFDAPPFIQEDMRRPFGFGFGRPGFGRPGFFGPPFLGGFAGGLLAGSLLAPGFVSPFPPPFVPFGPYPWY